MTAIIASFIGGVIVGYLLTRARRKPRLSSGSGASKPTQRDDKR